MSQLLPITILSPFLAAVVLLLLPQRAGRALRLVSLAGALVPAVTSVMLLRAYDAGVGRLSVRRRVSADSEAGPVLALGRRWDQRAARPADRDHPSDVDLHLVDLEDPREGVLPLRRAPGDRRLRRLRLARPVHLLPLLRAGRPADVRADRHLGLVDDDRRARSVRPAVRLGRRRTEGIRRDEADAVPARRVGVHPARDLHPLGRRRAARSTTCSSRPPRSTAASAAPSCCCSTSASACSPGSGRSTRGRPTAMRRPRPPAR